MTMYKMAIIEYGIILAAHGGRSSCSNGCGARACAKCIVCREIDPHSGGSRPVDGHDPSLLARALGRPPSMAARCVRSQSQKQISTVAAAPYLIAAP